jgi:DNA-binding CsgD family transcriptional regulator
LLVIESEEAMFSSIRAALRRHRRRIRTRFAKSLRDGLRSLRVEGVPDGLVTSRFLRDGRDMQLVNDLRCACESVPIGVWSPTPSDFAYRDAVRACMEDAYRSISVLVLERSDVVAALDELVPKCVEHARTPTWPRRYAWLSNRELEIAGLVREGIDSRKDLAEAAACASGTAKTLAGRLLRKTRTMCLRELRF